MPGHGPAHSPQLPLPSKQEVAEAIFGIGRLISLAVTCEDAIEAMAECCDNQRLQNALLKVVAQLKAGGVMADGFSESPDIFDKTFIFEVHTAENQGDIDAALMTSALTMQEDSSVRLYFPKLGKDSQLRLLTIGIVAMNELALMQEIELPLSVLMQLAAAGLTDQRYIQVLETLEPELRRSINCGEILARYPELFPRVYTEVIKAIEVGPFGKVNIQAKELDEREVQLINQLLELQKNQEYREEGRNLTLIAEGKRPLTHANKVMKQLADALQIFADGA